MVYSPDFSYVISRSSTCSDNHREKGKDLERKVLAADFEVGRETATRELGLSPIRRL